MDRDIGTPAERQHSLQLAGPDPDERTPTWIDVYVNVYVLLERRSEWRLEILAHLTWQTQRSWQREGSKQGWAQVQESR